MTIVGVDKCLLRPMNDTRCISVQPPTGGLRQQELWSDVVEDTYYSRVLTDPLQTLRSFSSNKKGSVRTIGYLFLREVRRYTDASGAGSVEATHLTPSSSSQVSGSWFYGFKGLGQHHLGTGTS